MSTLFFCIGLYQVLFDEEQRLKMKKIEKETKEEKRGKRKNKTTRSSDLSSSPFNHPHSTIYANLVFSPRIPIFSLIFILGIVTGITSRKALLFPSYKPSYFLSFGTDLLRDFYTFLPFGLPNWEVWCGPMLILFVDVGFVIVDGVFCCCCCQHRHCHVLAAGYGLGLGWGGEW